MPEELKWPRNKRVDTIESMSSGELTLIRMQGKRSKSFMVGSTLQASETEVVEIKRKFDGKWRKRSINKPTAISYSQDYNLQM